MKHLIVAIDFSKEAENALEYAGALAQQAGAKVIIFNSFTIPVHASNSLLPASVYQEMIDQNILLLKRKAGALAEAYGVETGIEAGSLDMASEIDEILLKYESPLLVMGMAAQSLEQDLFGNTTTSIIMKLKYPVLAVPLSARFKGIRKILFACDEVSDKTLLEKIRDLASAFGSEIEIFHVSKADEPVNRTNDPEISMILDDVPHSFKNIQSAAVIREIENEIKNTAADLLIMVPRKYNFLQAIIHRSKTRIMASNNNVPLLSLPLDELWAMSHEL